MAIEIVIGRERYAGIEDQLIHPGRHGIESLMQERDARWWNDAAAQWRGVIQTGSAHPEAAVG